VKLVAVRVNGEELSADAYDHQPSSLTLKSPPTGGLRAELAGRSLLCSGRAQHGAEASRAAWPNLLLATPCSLLPLPLPCLVGKLNFEVFAKPSFIRSSHSLLTC
jgi:hypothetical protein